MMANWIHDIEIKNFKSIRHQKIEDCRRVNVFIGYPNVGKSNILEALSLFNIDQLGDVDLRRFLRFENYSNLFFNNNTSNTISVSLDVGEKIHLKLDGKGKQLLVRSESRKMSFELEIPLKEFRIDGMAYGINASDEYDSLERLPIRKYLFSDAEEHSFGFTKELLTPFGENLADIISNNDNLKKEVVDLLKSYNLKYAKDEANHLKIVKEYKDQEVKIFPWVQLADTLRRLIFFKAAVASNTHSVLIFEEPEAHMFSPYISKFTSDVIHNNGQNQYFIATHSPFVLNDFMEDMEREDFAVYTVGYKKEDGETVIKRLMDEEITEIYQYGIDLFFNLENYLKDAV